MVKAPGANTPGAIILRGTSDGIAGDGGAKGVRLLEAARPERAEAPSPGHRPGYNSNQQDAL